MEDMAHLMCGSSIQFIGLGAASHRADNFASYSVTHDFIFKHKKALKSSSLPNYQYCSAFVRRDTYNTLQGPLQGGFFASRTLGWKVPRSCTLRGNGDQPNMRCDPQVFTTTQPSSM